MNRVTCLSDLECVWGDLSFRVNRVTCLSDLECVWGDLSIGVIRVTWLSDLECVSKHIIYIQVEVFRLLLLLYAYC